MTQSPFNWHWFNWFGPIIGATVWMLIVAAVLTAWHETRVAVVPLFNFVLVNLLAILLWQRRTRMSAFHALMTILAALAIALPVTWFSVMHFASPQALAAMNWPKSVYSMLVVGFMAPGFMLRFWLMERNAAPS